MKKPLNHMGYRNRPDYATEMRLHDGSVETIKHCGRCMSIIWRKTCDHCTEHDAKEDVRKEKFKAFLDSKKQGVEP